MEQCCICLEKLKVPKTLQKCQHTFCRACIDKAFEVRTICPVCLTVYGCMTGNQPDGKMTSTQQQSSLPGYPRVGTIVIHYSFSPGVQGSKHPNPGQQYAGTNRIAYLPDNAEGKKVLALLRRSFNQRLTFTVGTSITTGLSNQITWNDIHHKTSPSGGQTKLVYDILHNKLTT